MINRADYGGPLTKSAEEMFARAERRARRMVGGASRLVPRSRPPSRIREAANALGLALTTIRHWEHKGLIKFKRANGRRVVDPAVLACLEAIRDLRRADFSVRQIANLSNGSPPTVAQLRQALPAFPTPTAMLRAEPIEVVLALSE